MMQRTWLLLFVCNKQIEDHGGGGLFQSRKGGFETEVYLINMICYNLVFVATESEDAAGSF